VPLTIRADVPFQGYKFSIDFDEEVLEATSVEPAWMRPDGAEYMFFSYVINSLNEVRATRGSMRDTSRWGHPIAQPHQSGGAIPHAADTDNLALNLHFRVKPDTTASVAEVRCLDWGRLRETETVRNSIIHQGGEITTAETANSFISSTAGSR